MNYSLSLLASKSDCQSLIDIAVAEKGNLLYRQTGLQRQRDSVSLTSSEIETELVSVTAEIGALQTVIGSLPEGPVKQDNTVKLRKAEHKKFLLEQRKGNYGVLSLLVKEYDISCIEKSVAETDTFIQELTTLKSSLP